MDEYLLEKMEIRQAEELAGRIKDQQALNSLVPRLKEGEFLAEDCAECGEPLPLFRKQCGLVVCVPCLTRAENLRKLGR